MGADLFQRPAPPAVTLTGGHRNDVTQRCSRRHRGGTVLIHPLPHQHVCVRHNIRLGTLGPDSSSQPNGTR